MPTPAATALLAALGLTPGDGPPPAVPPASVFAASGASAEQDLIILGENRPIFLRLRVLVDDQPFRAAWLDAVGTAHARLDRNHDGKVTVDEADTAGLGLLLGPSGPNPANRGVAVDKNPADQAISVAELAEALGGPASAFRLGADGVARRRTDALFEHLDRDKDGSIARAELAAAVGSLRQLDRDADEWIDGAEVSAGVGEIKPATMTPLGRATPRDAGMPTVLTRDADESPLRVIRTLIKRYDSGSSRGLDRPDMKLSAAEFGIPPARFATADGNGDGLLTNDELRKWLATNPTDAVLDVVFSSVPAGPAAAQLRTSDGGLPVGFTVRHLGAGQVEVEVGVTRIDIQCDPGTNAQDAARRNLIERFEAADTSQDGYLDGAEANGEDGQPGPFAALYRPLDRDGDGKLTRAELDEAITQQAAATRAKLTLNATNEGRSVFGLLDRNGDRRLGAREVMDAGGRLAASDRDDDGRVVPDEVTQQIHLTLTRGDLTPLFVVPGVNLVAATGQRAVVSSAPGDPAAGPSWFRKMDRNHDGDVSRREFLGTHPQFDRLDLNRDGLLAPAEAEAAGATASPAPVKGPGG